ncbi:MULTISPECIES: 3-methyl-2-oxobutanoate hydroxymethyltransferase [Prochlorococcus]|uniref:3-methyl-2-oxobutanoate hydroxymethyltransferase n=1 Tax=Prochlorococcus marinus (strain SARG / CCMP1375 / SS120) TaxID=167539 RepID=PANB_PROMA|nr:MULTISPECIES: 3-methyl-2-oxobutanoate hydroxymethyltransferase [Prochlorococcus]Q93JX5.1 RecName: Full=3-methyl-2-oxobutanoate hydroxymethyltransferase; AltName: Full=Ketopantoate hydroxymethyltransferase; Short=KPHMT [Prochlorococcus marinus subsp. marinus str. CCMP1375]CAB95029.1 3-Methyl-2-oxobutanoate hydroxymethyltransferase [Prochlorococcus marinus]AAQ00428.1 Ketopantoate hydroxymethyltransferase [Prochlorococcus marinus subsp. marinus str. CCMP1375]KGG14310.1 3-methyl-2-oxobutanoate h
MLPKELVRFKELGNQITILTAWDSLSSAIVEAAGADVVLVGDSLAMFIHGHTTTLPVTLEQMLHHTQAVGRGFLSPKNKQPLVVCDLPFLSYQCGEDKAVAAAGTLLKNSCAAAVKIEGAEPEVISVIERLIRMGIPVMGHLGLTPQSVNNLGYHRQAEDALGQEKLVTQALKIEQVGCFSVVLEHVPSKVASKVTQMLKIPVIGIGAGEECDGQVRVTADLLGLTDKQPPFAKPLIDGRSLFIESLTSWVDQLRN